MQEQRQDPMIEEALRWLVVLKDKRATDADRREFERWLAIDARHEAAWRRAQYVWARLDTLRPGLQARGPRPALPVRRTLGRRRWLHAAAAVAAVAVPTGIVLSRPGLFADYGSSVGERRTISLEDGSTIELGGASSLSVDFAANARHVVLHDGEAFFKVSPDPERPFIVKAAAGQTQALGTAFDIKRRDDAVIVAVAEHSVAVSINGGRRVVVGEGQQIRYGGRRLGALREADLGLIEAWRRDRLVFQEVPLGDVIADLERYRGGRIIVTDSRLRDIPVTAVFDARQADAALDTIAATLPIRMHRVTGLLVVLSPTT